MPTYTATFRTSAEFATTTIKAKNPEAALRAAQRLWDRNQQALVFQRYDEIMPLTDIEITNRSGKELNSWIDHEELLRGNAALLMLALEDAITALNTAPRFDVPSLGINSYDVIRECEETLAAACGKDA